MTNARRLGLLPLLLVSCGPHPTEQNRLSPVESFERLAVPPDADGGCMSPVSDANSVTVMCDLTIPGSQESYRDWVYSRFSDRFQRREISKGRLLMTRYDDGETQEIDIVMNSVSDSRTRLRITLRVYAD